MYVGVDFHVVNKGLCETSFSENFRAFNGVFRQQACIPEPLFHLTLLTQPLLPARFVSVSSFSTTLKQLYCYAFPQGERKKFKLPHNLYRIYRFLYIFNASYSYKTGSFYIQRQKLNYRKLFSTRHCIVISNFNASQLLTLRFICEILYIRIHCLFLCECVISSKHT